MLIHSCRDTNGCFALSKVTQAQVQIGFQETYIKEHDDVIQVFFPCSNLYGRDQS